MILCLYCFDHVDVTLSILNINTVGIFADMFVCESAGFYTVQCAQKSCKLQTYSKYSVQHVLKYCFFSLFTCVFHWALSVTIVYLHLILALWVSYYARAEHASNCAPPCFGNSLCVSTECVCMLRCVHDYKWLSTVTRQKEVSGPERS